VLEKTSPTTKGKSWVLEIFGIQLGEAFGSLYLHLLLYLGGIISHTHYSALCIPDLLYYCMRSAI
jgi:hypothetical protein